MLGLLPEIVRLLAWPARLYADYSPQLVTIHRVPAVAHIPGALIVVGYIGALVWSWRRNRALALGLTWIPLALALVANLAVPTGILLAERTLFLPTVGAALIVGAAVGRFGGDCERVAPHSRTLCVMVGGAVIVLGAAHSAERQQVWRSNETLVTSLVVDAPSNFRGHFWLGDALLRRGKLLEGEQVMRRAIRLWPDHDGPLLGLALRYQERGLCEPALPLYSRARALEPTRASPHFGYSGCLLSLGRLREARETALAGLATGRTPGAFRFLLYQADSALAATDSVAGSNWWLRRQAVKQPQ